MRISFLNIFLIFFLSHNCLYSTDTLDRYIVSIERTVYLNDSVYSSNYEIFEDKGLFKFHSIEALRDIARQISDTTALKTKYLEYKVLLSDSSFFMVVSNYPQQLDTLILFYGKNQTDETFNPYWWRKEEDIIVIQRESSKNH